MKTLTGKAGSIARRCILVVLFGLAIGFAEMRASAQTRPASERGPIPNATREQIIAVGKMNADLLAAIDHLAANRADATKASLTPPQDDAAIKPEIQAIAESELALANARADALAKIQTSSNKLSPEQIAVLQTTGGLRRTGNNAGPIPDLTSNQCAALTNLTGEITPLSQDVTAARAAVVQASFADPRDDASIKIKVDAVDAAEMALAKKRAEAFAKIQDSPNKLAPDQIAAFAAMGGALIAGSFNEPQPIDFNDHAGYVSLFDGKTLKGWDGDPKYWRVEDGAIIGESTPQNPVRNTYLAYRDIEAKDFTLKFEIRIDGNGGSGVQYRSKTNIPWLAAAYANPLTNLPINPNWMMTGPQADFWPAKIYSGQFYSENTPMRIMAYRGQVVEGAGLGPRRLMANIGDRAELGKLVKPNDWNEYVVIARGGTFIHILNGQLMAVMIDDDPTSSNNVPGLVGIEIESTTKVSVRNIWMKKLN
ncbi:MAG TPA: family 16 glycoside hydrolase [Tepidisphaeraceae bacterium]|jgi:hypothetical protein|nr:family 16 glycoside hydrolase [Tepidisphaeraceae bacterium]